MELLSFTIVVTLVFVVGCFVGSRASRRVARREFANLRKDLAERLHAFTSPREAPAPEPQAAEEAEEIDTKTLAILSAAVAAFLGKRARIRQAKLVSTGAASPWAYQGRVSIHASHILRP